MWKSHSKLPKITFVCNFLIFVFSCKNIEKIEIEKLKILEMDSENVKNTMALILNFKSVN